MPSTNVFTTPGLAYLRFHGRNVEAWFAEDANRDARYNYDYSAKEFDTYMGMIKKFRERGGTLYVIFNNHYRAFEVKNTLEFIHEITGKPVKIMPKLLKTYPELEKIARPSESPKKEIEPGETYDLFGD